MAVKIRFARVGRHKDPFYRIVVADSRYSATGRYIEQLGYYDPNKGQEEAVIDLEKAREWIQKGARPSDSVRSILSKKGLYKDVAPVKKEKKVKEAKAAPKKEEAKAKPEEKAVKKVSKKAEVK